MVTPGFSGSLDSGQRPDCFQVPRAGWPLWASQVSVSLTAWVSLHNAVSYPGRVSSCQECWDYDQHQGTSHPLSFLSMRAFPNCSCLFPPVLPQCSLTKMINSQPHTLTAKSAQSLKYYHILQSGRLAAILDSLNSTVLCDQCVSK